MRTAHEAERVVVLMYHRVGQPVNAWERKYCVTKERFEGQMRALAAQGMSACSLQDFVAWLQGQRPLPEYAFLLTFDDGFLGVYQQALSVLSRFGWPATVFLVSGHIGATDEWTASENPSGRTYPLLGAREIAMMRRQAITFQSHSRRHRDLTTLNAGQLADELAGSKRDLEALLESPVDYLAYPYGRYDENVVDAAKNAGYRAAFSVQPGFNRPDVDPFRIRRLDVFGTDTPAQLVRKVRFGSNNGSVPAALRYYGTRLLERAGIW
jgi:peptidoglycan/xylan/chitin deacetylase (PgdA/CDA1 family)